MRAVAYNPAFAKKVGVPQSVGREFAAADKAKRKRTVREDLNAAMKKHGR